MTAATISRINLPGVEKISLAEFHERLKQQGVPREHLAFRCVMCGTVQSITSLLRAGVKPEEVDRYIGFSCVGRWTQAGPHQKGSPPGRGCDWTLGGLFHLHRLEVEFEDGLSASFVIASSDEAKALMRSWTP